MDKKIIIGFGSCGIAAGAEKVLEKINSILAEKNIAVPVEKTGCIGMCFCEVLLEIEDESGRTMYGNVTAENVSEIIDSHLINGNVIEDIKAIDFIFGNMIQIDEVKVVFLRKVPQTG